MRHKLCRSFHRWCPGVKTRCLFWVWATHCDFVHHWLHDDVINWKHFPWYWPFVRGIHRSPVNSPHKGQRRGALMFSLICVWINGWVNSRETGDLRRYRAHCDVTVMWAHTQNDPCIWKNMLLANPTLNKKQHWIEMVALSRQSNTSD